MAVQSEMVKGICRIAIFILCAQVLVHFRPEKSYEKYLKMLVSAMILVLMLRPMSDFFNREDSESLEVRVARFEARLNERMQQAAIQAAQGEAMREQMTLEELRRRIVEDSSQPECTQSDSSQPAAAQPESAQPDSSQPECTQSDSSQPDSVQPDSSPSDANQSQSSRTIPKVDVEIRRRERGDTDAEVTGAEGAFGEELEEMVPQG